MALNGCPAKLSVTAITIGATAMIAGLPPAHARPPLPLAPPQVCSFTKDTFGFTRSDNSSAGLNAQVGGTNLGPRGVLFLGPPSTSEFDRSNGNVSGAISDFHMDFTVNYDDGPLSGKSDTYHGEITDQGAVTGWVLNSNPQINWNANPGSVKCTSDTVVPGAPVVPPQVPGALVVPPQVGSPGNAPVVPPVGGRGN